MKTIDVKTYTNIDGAHYFGGPHVVDNETAAKLLKAGAVELLPPTEPSTKPDEPKSKAVNS